MPDRAFVSHGGLSAFDALLRAAVYDMRTYEKAPGNSPMFRWAFFYAAGGHFFCCIFFWAWRCPQLPKFGHGWYQRLYEYQMQYDHDAFMD
jgi:hypothetical protein